jgi:uncharacterized protein
MNLTSHPASALAALLICAALLPATVSCRKFRGGGPATVAPVVFVAPELGSNQLVDLPGAVYQNQASSPIRWQPWTRTTIDRAKEAGRLMFVVIAMPQQPGYQPVLSALASSRDTLERINEGYVPVLVDGDAAREMGILTADLCAEIRHPLQLPLFLWMTYECNPVAWLPVSSPDADTVIETFDQSHAMVSRMWKDNPDYVLKNSALDNANRRGRIEQRKVGKVMSGQPAEDVVRSIRQLTSLYDTYTRSFDETGGLFPSGALELLAVASQRPGLPDSLRERCQSTVRELLADLLPSPIFDPLDGGVFSSRRGSSWQLPMFVRDCSSQARVAVALIGAHRATGDPLALERALAVIGYAEKAYGTPDGLFAVGLSPETQTMQWTWSVEEVRNTLNPEEAGWWIKAAGMNGLGNLASEVDPRREYFRRNTLGLAHGMDAYAKERNQTPAEFRAFFDASRAKLLDVRNRRLGGGLRDTVPHAASSFRMVSAYAAAFSATGEEAYREKAVKLLDRCRAGFADGPRLRVFGTATDPSLGEGRAFVYALALQSVLDVAAITSDEKWNVWSEDLATTAAELFTGDGFLRECPETARLIDIPVTDLIMLFDDSTAGLISMAECRLAEIGRPLVESFSQLATPLPSYCIDRPVLHSDLLTATVCRHFRVTAVLGADLSPEMKLAVERLPVRFVSRRPATASDEVPAGAVKILLHDNQSVTATTPAQLTAAIFPAPATP